MKEHTQSVEKYVKKVREHMEMARWKGDLFIWKKTLMGK